MKQINEEADEDEQILRISIDAKATVKVGPDEESITSFNIVLQLSRQAAPDSRMTPGKLIVSFNQGLVVR